jgi:hypothetical protein
MICCNYLAAQDSTSALSYKNHLRVVFYNVENLFDTENDSLKNDDEFLPTGMKGWSRSRYWEKLDHIFKTLLAAGEWEPPALVGLCEVENRTVLYDLISRTPIRRLEYQIIHEESPDARGIDVALLYRTDKFRPLHHEAIPIRFPDDPNSRTRDVLYVKGTVFRKDTLHIFVNHWPSRAGGQAESAPKRMFVAKTIRAKVDSLFSVNADACILITGDFNDEPEDESILTGLNAKTDPLTVSSHDLLNGMYPYLGKFTGTEKHQGHWHLLDQFIFSEGLLHPGKGLSVNSGRGYIFDGAWLLEPDNRFMGIMPFRTYAGPRYLGGYSDHLPVYIDLVKE